MAVQYKRILLKVSGEALSGEKGTGFDEATIASICAGIKAAYDLGAQIGIVVGGGKFCLLLFQLGLPLGKQCLTAGQLFLPLGLVHFCHGGILRRFFYQYTIEL